MISTAFLKDLDITSSSFDNSFVPDDIYVTRLDDVRIGMTINSFLYTALIEKVVRFLNYRIPPGRCYSVVFKSDKVYFCGAYETIELNLKLKLMRKGKSKCVFMFYNDVCYVSGYRYFIEFLAGLRNFAKLSNVYTLNIKNNLQIVSDQDIELLEDMKFRE